jgi:hypothetical protein
MGFYGLEAFKSGFVVFNFGLICKMSLLKERQRVEGERGEEREIENGERVLSPEIYVARIPVDF